MKNINVLGQDILVNDILCSTDINSKKRVNPALRLYIKLNEECNAKCKFCVNEKSCNFGNIDFSKLEYVISYLYNNNLLHSIGITGGEPMLYPEKVYKLINMIYKISRNIEVQINTNGVNLLELLNFDDINNLESIHISRHHYMDSKNYEIFGTNKIAKTEDIAYLQSMLKDKKIININTMVMKDYIENLKEIKNMLNYVGDIDVYKNGFVSLIKCNSYAKDHFINFNNIFNNLDSDFYLGHHFYKDIYCECIDGMYMTNNSKLVEFYARMITDKKTPYVNNLVYEPNNILTANFNGKVLYK